MHSPRKRLSFADHTHGRLYQAGRRQPSPQEPRGRLVLAHEPQAGEAYCGSCACRAAEAYCGIFSLVHPCFWPADALKHALFLHLQAPSSQCHRQHKIRCLFGLVTCQRGSQMSILYTASWGIPDALSCIWQRPNPMPAPLHPQQSSACTDSVDFSSIYLDISRYRGSDVVCYPAPLSSHSPHHAGISVP